MRCTTWPASVITQPLTGNPHENHRHQAYSIESPVTDWTYVKIETDELGLHGWGEAPLPTKPRDVLGAVGDLKKLLV